MDTISGWWWLEHELYFPIQLGIIIDAYFSKGLILPSGKWWRSCFTITYNNNHQLIGFHGKKYRKIPRSSWENRKGFRWFDFPIRNVNPLKPSPVSPVNVFATAEAQPEMRNARLAGHRSGGRCLESRSSLKSSGGWRYYHRKTMGKWWFIGIYI